MVGVTRNEIQNRRTISRCILQETSHPHQGLYAMNKEFALRNKDETSPREYRKPSFCECSHGKDKHHEGLFFRGKCNICKCPKYVRDTDLEGYYVECDASEADLFLRSLARGSFNLKQVTGERVENKK